MLIPTVIFLTSIFLTACVEAQSQDRVNVSLYYESLCPDCRLFVKDQLYPTVRKIGQFFDLHLVPYGNAERRRVDNEWEFQCQHGVEECYGNKVQACALSMDARDYQKVGFVGCIMSSEDPGSARVGRKCAQQVSLHWDLINKCATGEQGDTLLAEYGEETDSLQPPHQYVPWILWNGVYNSTMNDEAQDNLLEVVCSLMEHQPDKCIEQNNKVSTVHTDLDYCHNEHS